jgi:glycosyltransferase involved in cell wall biosynthesis
MTILFLDAYFEPERTSFTHLERDLLKSLISAGHSVKVICPVPTRGIDKKTADEYKKRKTETVYGGHVHVTRFASVQEGKNPIIRAIRYFWCNYRTYRIGKKATNVDVVFSNSTPPTQGFIAAKVAKKLHAAFIYNLQDIFPDSLVNAGMTNKGSLLYKIGRKIEDYTYKCADRIIVIGESFKNNIISKGVPEAKIKVIPNWIDTETIKPISRPDNTLFDECGIDRDKFIVLYAGNFGATQGTNTIINAADILKDEADIQFVLFGNGSEFEATKRAVSDRRLTNVIINPLLPPERIPEVYSMGDVALITCKKGAGGAAIPSKTWSIMACNTPIIACFDTDSELADVLTKSGSGVCVTPGDGGALADTILKAKNGELIICGGREYVTENADRKICLDKYAQLFKSFKV